MSNENKSYVTLDNRRSICANNFSYYHISDVKQVYLSGNAFLKFTYIEIISQVRQTACVACNSVTNISYYNITPELKTQADVLKAYREKRLVGY
jgi:hypothetical protein